MDSDSVAYIVIGLWVILMVGEPDLLDALISLIGK